MSVDWSKKQSPWRIIKSLQLTTKRNDKIRIIEQVPYDNPFWRGTFNALDQLTTFGVKKIPKWEEGTFQHDDPHESFWILIDKLVSREITGHRATEDIISFMKGCTEEQWNYWYSRIIEKRLGCGADKIITDRAPEEFKARVWPWHGAVALKSLKHDELPTDAFVEAKYDGERTFWVIKPNDPVRCFSRNGKEYHNFGLITEQLELVKTINGFPDIGIVLDGEVISSDFQTLATQARRKTDAKFDGMLMLFDIIDAETFFKQEETGSLKERRQVLEYLVYNLKEKIDGISFVELSHALKGINARDDFDTVMDFFSQQIEARQEGIIIKDSNSGYEYKRHKSWIKHKPSETFDMTVVGYEEGTNRLKNMLGAFLCEVEHEGDVIRARVGSGFSDQTRIKVWEDPDKHIGSVIEVEADKPTKNKNEEYSLRFPVFKRFRDDK